MKGIASKSRGAFPVPEKEIGAYLNTVFSSRFSAPGLEREESIQWIRGHFPSWIDDARKEADAILKEGIRFDPAPVEQPIWKQRWKGARPSAADGEGQTFSFRPNGAATDSVDLLLPVAKAYWYTDHAVYRDFLIPKLSFLSSRRSPLLNRHAAPLFPPWKMLWLLRFAAEGAAAEIEKMWEVLLMEAAKICRNGGRESAEDGLFLLMMGVLFREDSESGFWKSRGIKIMERELFRKVGRDGVCRSKRLSDQLCLVQLYLQAFLIGRKIHSFSEKAVRRVEKMLEFLWVNQSHSLLTGTASRSLFSLARFETRGVNKALGLGGIVFGRSEFREAGDLFSEEAFFLAGPEKSPADRQKSSGQVLESAVFDEAGYAVLKSRFPDEKTLIFQVEPPAPFQAKEMGEGPFSFSIGAPESLFVRKPVVSIEPPAGRQTGIQGPFSRTKLKNGKEKPPLSRFFLGEDFDYLEGEQPVQRTPASSRQKRSILFVKPSYWIFHDFFSGKGTFGADWIFPFSPEATIDGSLAEGFHVAAPNGHLGMVPLGTHLKGIDIQNEMDEKRLAISVSGALPLSLTNILYPDKKDDPYRYDFKSLYFPSIEAGTAFELLNSVYTDTVLISPPSGKVSLSNIVFEGELLFVRKDYLGEISRVFALSGRSCFLDRKLLFESAKPVRFLELSYRGEILYIRGEISGPISLYPDGVEEVWVNGEKTYFTRDRGRLILHF